MNAELTEVKELFKPSRIRTRGVKKERQPNHKRSAAYKRDKYRYEV